MKSAAERLAASAGGMTELLEFVSQHTGLVFPPNRRATAEGGVQRALRRTGIADAGALLARVREDLETLDELLAELTIGETYFFREEGQFDFMRSTAIPQLLGAHADHRVLRGWSAACASGEEAYSLAITLRETAPHSSTHVIGTDVSRHRLRAAQRAVYKDWSLRGVTPERVGRYFSKQGNAYRLREGDRVGVEFRYLNLAEDVFPAIASGIWGMDIIMCRNVLIYFDAETIQRVSTRLLESLSDDGWLFMGASDPAISDFLACDVELTGAGVAYRRPHGRGRARAWPGTELTEAAPAVLAPEPIQEWVSSDAYTSLEPVIPSPEPVVSCGDWITRVRGLANAGQLEEAGKACATALDHFGTSAELMYLHAVLLAESGRQRECADAARRALYLDAQLVVAQLLLGGALAKLGDKPGAVRVLMSAERALSAQAPGQIVPASDGEPAGRLLQMARVQLKLIQLGSA